MESFSIKIETDTLRMTIEEWDVLFESMALGKERGIQRASDFYTPRLKAILESDELLPFEMEPEFALEEYLRIKWERGV